MKRDIYQKLQAWKSSSRRKPLILNGARQVGKTYALNYFAGQAYENAVYLNFEKDKSLSAYFEDSIEPHRIINFLSLHTKATITPEKTLLIFDEVQECPRALNSLKYFCEEANEYHVVGAGSLLGVKTKHTGGFPVGKVNFLDLYPLNFFEFLSALGEEKLRLFLEELTHAEPIATPLHEKLIELLKIYFYVGGMPEAVSEFSLNRNYSAVREIQLEILDAYERDFSKHAPPHQFMKILAIWQNVHTQLENKKFIFSVIKESARGRDYEEAIQWLLEAGLIYKCYHLPTPKLPLTAYSDKNIYKIYLLDVGLLGAQTNLQPETIIKKNELFTEYKGALTENYVAEELRSIEMSDLYYWTSSGTAEVDFIVERQGEILPLEVKAGTSDKKKSLLSYANKYNPPTLLRSSLMNLKHDGKLINYPLYLISAFKYISK
jgi:predicted AAA+ superfamily ATPase